MNPEIFHYAKKQAKEIHQESKSILPDHNLLIHESTLGFEIAQFWDGWTPYIEGINFGSYPLSMKKVKEIINDNEQLNYL